MNQQIQDIEKIRDDEIEINLRDIAQFLKENFRNMVLWGIGFAVLGAIYAFTAQKEFESKVIVLPEIQSSGSMGKLGGLSALAGLAGVDLTSMSNTDAIRPDLYPNVTQSLPFILHILSQKVYVSEYKKELILEQYFNVLNKSWLDSFFKGSVRPKLDPRNLSHAIELDKNKEALVKDLQSRIITSFDRKTGIITINVKMPDPVVAANVAQLSVEYLKDYVTSYRTEKARKQMTFLSQQVAEAKTRYQKAEAALASYRDRNSFLVMNTAKITEQRIQSEFILAQNVYNGLVQQYEQAKIRVEDETPVFKLLEPAKIPLKKSEPKRAIIMMMFIITGCIFYFCLTLLQKLLN